MPLLLAVLFRGLIVLAMGAHVFFMYSMARTMTESFGFRPGLAVGSALFALALMLPLVWAIGVPEIPDLWARYVKPRQRWRRDQCPGCGYPRSERSRCPECGREDGPPEAYRFRASMVRRFALLAALAWILGTGAGEGWVLLDEHAFRDEASTSNGWHARARRWPNDGMSLCYSIDGGPDGPDERFFGWSGPPPAGP